MRSSLARATARPMASMSPSRRRPRADAAAVGASPSSTTILLDPLGKTHRINRRPVDDHHELVLRRCAPRQGLEQEAGEAAEAAAVGQAGAVIADAHRFASEAPVGCGRWTIGVPKCGCGSAGWARAGAGQPEERVGGMAAESAGRRDRVADDRDGREVGRAQSRGLGQSKVGDFHRLETHHRRGHRINRDGIGAGDDRAQRNAPAVPGPFAFGGHEAIDQADLGHRERSQRHQAARRSLHRRPAGAAPPR